MKFQRPITIALIATATILIAGYVSWQYILGQRVKPPSEASSPAPALSLAVTLPTPSISPSVASPTPRSPAPTASPAVSAAPTPLAKTVRLAVPFTPQAPDADWTEPWKEGCEEAALLMIEAFHRGDKAAVLPAAATKKAIADMVTWQHKRFGGHLDLGVDDMAAMAKEYLGYKTARVVRPVSIERGLEEIRQELRAGHPVILPAAGQLLANPYFKQPGPVYHVFVITGYDGDDFIANENGTRRGRDYRYSATILRQAWHDYQAGEAITAGAPAYLVLEG